MRKFKFRAWHKLANYMCENVTVNFFDRDYLEIMQYTGLKDINGKEIYEGDILQYIECADEFISPIVYDEEYAMFCFKNDAPNSLNDYEYLKVIGNIYQNLDLLEE